MFEIDKEEFRNFLDSFLPVPEKEVSRNYRISLDLTPFKNLEGFQKEVKDSLISLLDDSYYFSRNLFFLEKENHFVKTSFLKFKDYVSFRNTNLISPIYYLYYSFIISKIASKYKFEEVQNLEVFYGGRLIQKIKDNQFYYKKEYEKYINKIETYKKKYNYYFFIDIKNFYLSINLDKLFKKIEDNLKNDNEFNAKNISFLKEFTKYLGNGKFPTIQGIIPLSFLATKIYLQDIDKKTSAFLQKELSDDFKMIRYVDDLVIFFSPKDEKNLIQKVEKILQTISIYYFEEDLSLNIKKHMNGVSEEVYKVIKFFQQYSQEYKEEKITKIDKILMDYFKDQDFKTSIKNKFKEFLKELNETEKIDYRKYLEIEKKLQIEDGNKHVYIKAKSFLHNLIYSEKKEIFEDQEIQELLLDLLENKYYLIKYDPDFWTSVILKNQDNEVLIKKFLRKLYKETSNKVNKEEFEEASNTLLVVNYLLQRNFEKDELLNYLEKKSNNYYDFIKKYSYQKEKNYLKENNFAQNLIEKKKENLQIRFLEKLIKDFPKEEKVQERVDEVIEKYALYLFNYYQNDYLKAYSYYFNHYFLGMINLMDFFSNNLNSYKESFLNINELNPILDTIRTIIKRKDLKIIINSELKKNLEEEIRQLNNIRNTSELSHFQKVPEGKKKVDYKKSIERAEIILNFLLKAFHKSKNGT